MKSQLWSAPNQLTLLRLIFVPFVIMNVMDADYKMALALFILAGISDALDGLLARFLHQQTTLGQYLDPIADKLLLSSLFLVLSFVHEIPWRYTVLVFSRDLCLVAVAATLYITTNIRDFRPSIFGKVNTFVQICAVFFVLLVHVFPKNWISVCRHSFLVATFVFTLISGLHYVIRTGQQLRSAQSRSQSVVPHV